MLLTGIFLLKAIQATKGWAYLCCSFNRSKFAPNKSTGTHLFYLVRSWNGRKWTTRTRNALGWKGNFSPTKRNVPVGRQNSWEYKIKCTSRQGVDMDQEDNLILGGCLENNYLVCSSNWICIEHWTFIQCMLCSFISFRIPRNLCLFY